jgi:cation:H+ antiporter
VLLALGTDSLLRGASGLALRRGANPFGIGVLLVGTAASLPVLAVVVAALVQDHGELGLGAVVGASLVNFGLILGSAALMAPLALAMRMLRVQAPALIAAVLLLAALAWDGSLSRVDGGVLLAGFLLLLVLTARAARSETASVRALLADVAETRTEVRPNLIRLAVGIVLLAAAARFMVEAALVFAAASGFSALAIGLTLMAIAVALPAWAAALLAVRFGRGDTVPATVLGAGLCNLLLVLGGAALFAPLAFAPALVRCELVLLLAFAAAFHLKLRSTRALQAREGVVLLCAFVLLLSWQLWRAWPA